MNAKQNRPLANGEWSGASRQQTVTHHYSILEAAAALQRATAEHLREEIGERQRRGQPLRDLCKLYFFAAWVHDRLAELVIREGGRA